MSGAPTADRKHAKLLRLAQAADDGGLDWHRDTLNDFPPEDQNFMNAASPQVVSELIKETHEALDALKDLAAQSWLEPDPSDTDELAKAKDRARSALNKYHG
jgi:hypothetical protein